MCWLLNRATNGYEFIGETMIISDSKKYIFIHIPRTAGISMHEALRPWADARNIDMRTAKWESNYPHYVAAEIRQFVGDARFAQYFKFAFVRNPWDRMVSRYSYLKKLSNKPAARKNLRGFVSPGNLTFPEWLQGEGGECVNPLDLQPQIEWMGSENRIIIDYVGRFEQIESDFAVICQRLGLDAKLPHINNSEHRDYRSYYNEESKQFVANIFQADIKAWGYKF
jgi:hypothetical protein